MTTVWKYQHDLLDGGDFATFEMPEGAEVRHVGMQDGLVTLWAEVDAAAWSTPRTFVIGGTGHQIPEGARYVGTVHDGPFVWHIFEVLS